MVTGSGRNIGRTAAEALATAGKKVVINGRRDHAALDDAVASAGGDAAAHRPAQQASVAGPRWSTRPSRGRPVSPLSRG